VVNIPVIARRELNTYFLSPMAYVVLTGFAVVNALFFAATLRGGQLESNQLVTEVFSFALFWLIFAAPIITMRLLSEEAATGTLETLLTTPVSDTEVVLGKFTGALLFSLVLLVPLGLEFAFLAAIGPLDYGPVASGLLGMYLVSAEFLAVGLLCSALTRSQIASGILAFVGLMALFFLWLGVRERTSGLASFLRYLAPSTHLSGFVRGVIDSRDLAYFVLSTALLLFLSVKILESRKWR